MNGINQNGIVKTVLEPLYTKQPQGRQRKFYRLSDNINTRNQTIHYRDDAARVVKIKSESSVQKLGQQKKDWGLTPNAFRRLLEWLDEGADSGGQKYLEMRRRLVAYFDRKNCLTPDELADETLNRVSRRLEEEGEIESDSPAKYCYIVARFIFMEYLRGAQNKTVPIDEALLRSNANDFVQPEPGDEKEIKEAMLDCLEQCMGKLEPVSRDIIIRYYFGEERVKIENRRALAASLNITMNALTIRACRIRDKLEACVGKCSGAM